MHDTNYILKREENGAKIGLLMGYLDFHKEQGDMMDDTNLMWKYVGYLWQVGSLSCDNSVVSINRTDRHSFTYMLKTLYSKSLFSYGVYWQYKQQRGCIDWFIVNRPGYLCFSVLSSFMTYNGFITRVTRRVPLVEQERLSRPEFTLGFVELVYLNL